MGRKKNTDAAVETIEDVATPATKDEPALVNFSDDEITALDGAFETLASAIKGTLTLPVIAALTAADAASHVSEMDAATKADILKRLDNPQESTADAAKKVNALRAAIDTIVRAGVKLIGQAEHRRGLIVQHVNCYELELKRLIEKAGTGHS